MKPRIPHVPLHDPAPSGEPNDQLPDLPNHYTPTAPDSSRPGGRTDSPVSGKGAFGSWMGLAFLGVAAFFLIYLLFVLYFPSA